MILSLIVAKSVFFLTSIQDFWKRKSYDVHLPSFFYAMTAGLILTPTLTKEVLGQNYSSILAPRAGQRFRELKTNGHVCANNQIKWPRLYALVSSDLIDGLAFNTDSRLALGWHRHTPFMNKLF